MAASSPTRSPPGLELPFETAESVKRQVGNVSDDVVARARTSLERPLASMLDEVRSSLDYYRNQPGAARLLRVVATGGGALLPGIVDRLSTLVGLPVADGRAPLDAHRRRHRLRRQRAAAPRPVPARPRSASRSRPDRSVSRSTCCRIVARSEPQDASIAASAAAAAALIVLLAIPTVARQHSISHQHHVLAEPQQRNQTLQLQIGDLQSAQAKQEQLDSLRLQITGLLGADVSWSRMLQDIARTIPNDVWLTSFQGTVTPPVAAAPVTPTTVPGAETTTTAAGTTLTTTPPAVAASRADRHRELQRRRPRLPVGRGVDQDDLPASVALRPLGAERHRGEDRDAGRRELHVDRDAHAEGAVRPARALHGDAEMRSRVVVVGVLLTVVVVLIWNIAIFAPKGRKLSDAKKEAQAAQQLEPGLQATLARLKQISQNGPEIAAQLDKLSAAVPASPDLDGFILSANQIAVQAGIDWLSVSPSVVQAGTTGPSVIPLSVQIKGGFFQVLDYLNRLEDMGRLVIVDAINAQPRQRTGPAAATPTGPPTLSVTLTGRMFTRAAPARGRGERAHAGSGGRHDRLHAARERELERRDLDDRAGELMTTGERRRLIVLGSVAGVLVVVLIAKLVLFSGGGGSNTTRRRRRCRRRPVGRRRPRRRRRRRARRARPRPSTSSRRRTRSSRSSSSPRRPAAPVRRPRRTRARRPAPAPAERRRPRPPSNEPAPGTSVALLDVFQQGDGTPMAKVQVGSTVYTVGVGDVFASSYRVVSLNAPCGQFLFGDAPFKLCEGEEVIK